MTKTALSTAERPRSALDMLAAFASKARRRRMPVPAGVRSHVERALACAIRLMAAGDQVGHQVPELPSVPGDPVDPRDPRGKSARLNRPA